MELFLSEQCKSLTGSLGRGFGYSIQRQRGKFVSKRNSKGVVPPDGHWRFILACAQLAQSKLHITGLRVSWIELWGALVRAKHPIAAQQVSKNGNEGIKSHYDEKDIINLKITFSL
jgi:hypothetical protein